uniref:Uncharacterized protein n=1 Tax=Romanomermis culicivorax TaxID=13658 RepID=A0A915LBJ8_ROMCU
MPILRNKSNNYSTLFLCRRKNQHFPEAYLKSIDFRYVAMSSTYSQSFAHHPLTFRNPKQSFHLRFLTRLLFLQLAKISQINLQALVISVSPFCKRTTHSYARCLNPSTFSSKRFLDAYDITETQNTEQKYDKLFPKNTNA